MLPVCLFGARPHAIERAGGLTIKYFEAHTFVLVSGADVPAGEMRSSYSARSDRSRPCA